MPAGFFLAIAALVLFPVAAQRTAFVLCGLAVEILGLAVAVRGHMLAQGENRL
jgi:threonine/homoserine efflux transporter RhtA